MYGCDDDVRDTSLEKPNITVSGQALGSESSLTRHPNYATTPTIPVPSKIVGHDQRGLYGQSPTQGYNPPYARYNAASNAAYSPPSSPNPISGGQVTVSPPVDSHVSRASPAFSAQSQTADFTGRTQGSLDGPESKRVSSDSRELDLSKQMPVPALLPDTFGADDEVSARGSVDRDPPSSARTLKVCFDVEYPSV
jgi:hypothetical protein